MRCVSEMAETDKVGRWRGREAQAQLESRRWTDVIYGEDAFTVNFEGEIKQGRDG